MLRRYALLTLPLLLAAGCAQMNHEPGRDRANLSPAARFAGSVEASDHAMETAIGRMDAFERLAAREDTAISYAVGGNTAPQLLPPGGGVAETTGRVLAPAFTALGDYGHVLAQAAAMQPIQAKQSPSGADLAAAAGKALDELATTARVTVAPAVRTAGLAAIASLADLPEQLTKNTGSRPSLASLVSRAEPQVKALVVMLQAVVGGSTETGVRAVIRSRRLALDAAHGRFLAAVRADRTAGPADRYAIFRSVAELREGDPAQGTLAQVYSLLASLGQAHDALDEGAADADAKVAGFEGSVDRLLQLGEQTRRAGQ
jgi:hypothetical protein